MRLADVAQVWLERGVSCIPIQANKTKRPVVRWGDYQLKAPTLGQLDEWWGNGSPYGIALICGTVSGNLEMVELEGRAVSGDQLTEIVNRADELGIGHIWDLLNSSEGYSEMSPSGGLHLLYRIKDHVVPGNTKIAHNKDGLVLAETRGTGGYVIVAPTPGSCHPSGDAWTLLSGDYGTLPEITWYERCQLHEALRLALDEPAPDQPLLTTSPVPAVLPAPPFGSSTAGSLSPGDDYEIKTDWIDILGPHGWVVESTHGRTRNWTRPGKDPRHGASGTTNHASDRDRLYVFSTSTVFRAHTPYTKFAAYTLLNHGGDFHAAAVELKRQGFGQTMAVSTALEPWNPEAAQVDYSAQDANDIGNTLQLLDRVKGRFHYLAEEKDYVCWDGVKWSTDQRFALEYEFQQMAKELSAAAKANGDETWAKWWTRSGNRSRLEAALKGLRSQPGFTVTAAEMNRDRKVLNVGNGVMDLLTGQLLPHDPNLMMTRVMGASYDPEAQCPMFDRFMEKVLPNESMRRYVQRALGYSMLGDADQRSLFLVCGPSGTGKSTLMATMEMVFGDYGVPAPPGTLRAARGEGSSPSNDLHMLRGKRFVSTSETNEHTSYNEDLIKRLTGRDTISSRRLYQDFQDWSPVCTIWLATNHPPRFSSDDDAIWRRAKIIPFNTILLGEGEVHDYAHNVLADERDGILNWLLAGLR
ncbi:MAG TPA: phage/plasmid primase, P4 family, partial [Gemmatimonadales bacterium]|nr:phage/plasmid primase, P4 family [Gemmatimonadales bacterium]